MAKNLGFKVFALQAGGWCASSSKAAKTFNKYGMSSNCENDGEGGPNANQVYYIRGINPSTETVYVLLLHAHRKSKVALSFVMLSHDDIKFLILSTGMVVCKITYWTNLLNLFFS